MLGLSACAGTPPATPTGTGVAGTRIPKLVCATEDTLRNQSAESKQQIDDIRQTAGAGGCNPSDPMGC